MRYMIDHISHKMVPQDTNHHPVRLLVRHLPHDITAERVMDVVREGCGMGGIDDIVDVSIICGFPGSGSRPSVPSTAIIVLHSDQPDCDPETSRLVIRQVVDIFDGRTVFAGRSDCEDGLVSTVEWSPVYFTLSCIRCGAAEARVRTSKGSLAGTIEDDEDYQRFCGASAVAMSSEDGEAKCLPREEMGSEEREKTHESGDEPIKKPVQVSLLVSHLLTKLEGRQKNKKKMSMLDEKLEKKAKRRVLLWSSAQDDKATGEGGDEKSVSKESKARRVKLHKDRRRKSRRSEGGVVVKGALREDSVADVGTGKIRQRSGNDSTMKRHRNRASKEESRAPDAVGSPSDRRKQGGRHGRRGRRHQTEGAVVSEATAVDTSKNPKKPKWGKEVKYPVETQSPENPGARKKQKGFAVKTPKASTGALVDDIAVHKGVPAAPRVDYHRREEPLSRLQPVGIASAIGDSGTVLKVPQHCEETVGKKRGRRAKKNESLKLRILATPERVTEMALNGVQLALNKYEEGTPKRKVSDDKSSQKRKESEVP